MISWNVKSSMKIMGEMDEEEDEEDEAERDSL